MKLDPKKISIVAKTGAAIARHKDEAKKILAKYNIVPEKDSLGGIIKAAFVAIKGGNKDLAADLVALIHVKGNTPAARANFLDKIKGSIDKAKSALKIGKPVQTPSTGITPVMNAEGDADPIASDAILLNDAIAGGDVNEATKAALDGSRPTNEQLIYGFLIISAILVIAYFAAEKLPKMIK
jgi:hypothetical protein